MNAAKKAPKEPVMPNGGYKDYGRRQFQDLWQVTQQRQSNQLFLPSLGARDRFKLLGVEFRS